LTKTRKKLRRKVSSLVRAGDSERHGRTLQDERRSRVLGGAQEIMITKTTENGRLAYLLKV